VLFDSVDGFSDFVAESCEAVVDVATSADGVSILTATIVMAIVATANTPAPINLILFIYLYYTA